MSDETVERERFEGWAEAVYGGAMGKLQRDPRFPEEYYQADVHWAWQAWKYRAEHPEITADERKI
jgi:hypothetical protein